MGLNDLEDPVDEHSVPAELDLDGIADLKLLESVASPVREARPGNRALQLAIEIAKSLPVGTTLEELDIDKTEPLAGEVEWTAAGARVSVPAKGRHRAASIWITSNLTWIFPDDPALWRHLLHALASRAWPILLARKIAFSTFPLLKRLGALGLQLHHLFVPDGVPNEAPACNALASGPPILPPSVASAHCAVEEHLTAALLDGGDEVLVAADAIRLAARLGLDSEASNSLEALRAWTESTVIQMPPPWKAQLTRYERWSTPVLQKGASTRG